MPKPKFYITTAIPYANGAPHIGHAYERIATDAIARFKRLDGYDVFFVTGMDEHGQKMQQTAAREGITPLELADRTAAQFEQMGEDLNARADDILRTTQTRHKESVQEVWRRMAAKGDIYLSKYAGWYSVRDEAYYAEDETEVRDDRRFAVKTGTPGRMGRGGELFLQALGLCRQAAGTLREASGLHHAGELQERDRRLREARPQRPVGQPHHLRLGHPGAGRSEARHVCLGRCADELSLRHRLPG